MDRGGCLFAGGGTGGHLFPAIAVANELRLRDPAIPIHFAGSDRPLERRIVEGADYEHHALCTPSSNLARRQPVQYAVKFWRALREARQTLDELRPRVVIGCGGFTSVPPVRAALRAGTPVLLLEQNLLPGRATRWLSRRASAVCLSFEESRQFLSQRARCVVTGNPVRAEFLRPTASPSTPKAPKLLILGGSLGAGEINAAVVSGVTAAPDRWRDWEIVHQAGEHDFESIRSQYIQAGVPARVEPFLADVASQLASAAMVVMRAGATSLAEAACVGVACVVVPWKRAVDDHQTLNAAWYADRAAALVPPAVGGPEALWRAVTQLADDPVERAEMAARMKETARPDATACVADAILALAST